MCLQMWLRAGGGCKVSLEEAQRNAAAEHREPWGRSKWHSCWLNYILSNNNKNIDWSKPKVISTNQLCAFDSWLTCLVGLLTKNTKRGEWVTVTVWRFDQYLWYLKGRRAALQTASRCRSLSLSAVCGRKKGINDWCFFFLGPHSLSSFYKRHTCERRTVCEMWCRQGLWYLLDFCSVCSRWLSSLIVFICSDIVCCGFNDLFHFSVEGFFRSC